MSDLVFPPTCTPLKRYILYPLEALAVYVLYGFFWLFPLERASAIGGWIGRTLGPRLGASKKAIRNITRAMPELSAEEVGKIATGMWDNLGRVMAEYPHLDEFDPSRVEVEGVHILEQLHAARQPALLVSGHFANWEVIPITAAKRGLEMQLVYRHANNPYVDRLLSFARRPMGKHLARKGTEGARSVQRAIKQKRMVGLLVDQKDNRGQPVLFFNRPAMTSTAVAMLALHYKVPVVMVGLERLPSARFRMKISEPLAFPDISLPREQAMTEFLTRINQQLETRIRQNPTQWLWLHRRWGRD